MTQQVLLLLPGLLPALLEAMAIRAMANPSRLSRLDEPAVLAQQTL